MANNNKTNWNTARGQALADMNKAMENVGSKANPNLNANANPNQDTPMGTNDMIQGMMAKMDQLMQMVQDLTSKLDGMTGGSVPGGGIPQ